MSHRFTEIDQQCVNAIRVLAIDGVEKANSGHPGAPMGLAPAAYLLFTRFMRHNPENPAWPDRDRFVLSCGHASMLLYSVLHLTGYKVSLDDLKSFRQWHSITPGHPEHGLTPGVEATTGPLGQGCGMSVGLAMAEAKLAAWFNTPTQALIHHYTYVLCSDGDMMEGVSHEAAALAAHLKLGRLIWLYDDNKITIDGPTSLSFSEDVGRRFEAYGWHVLRVADGNNLDELATAIETARQTTDRPSFIVVKTQIGYGAPTKQGTPKVHGAPLGQAELEGAKKFYNWPSLEPFFVPEEVRAHFVGVVERGRQTEADWQNLYRTWREANPSLTAEWERIEARRLPDSWDADIPKFEPDAKGMGTRIASEKVLNAIAKRLPELTGGSADLAESVKTHLKDGGDFSAANYGGRNMHFGIREFGMGAAVNGLTLHGGLRPFGSTFLVFSDYMRPAVRLAALMKQPSIFVWSHDAINLGEDGPTHQPVEHLTVLRAIPNMTVFRPCDAIETAESWRAIIRHEGGPVGLILTRQNAPTLPETKALGASGVPAGGYILSEAAGQSQVILIATGFEVHLALAAQKALAALNIAARVVSMPCCEYFDRQDAAYRTQVLPSNVPKVAIEAGIGMGWHKYVGHTGAVVSLERFGESAPEKAVYEGLGFTVERVVETVKNIM